MSKQFSLVSSDPGELYSTTLNQDTLLRGKRLVATRSLWLAGVGLLTALFVISLPFYYQQVQQICPEVNTDNCPQVSLRTDQLQALQHSGYTVQFYAWFNLGLNVIFFGVFLGVAVLIFWRKSDDWFALFCGGGWLVFAATTSSDSLHGLGQALPFFSFPVALFGVAGFVLFPIFFLLFPNGHFVPRWTRWLIPVYLVWGFPQFFFPDSPFSSNSWPGPVQGLWWGMMLSILLVSQIYRYRKVSTLAERQQTKWLLYGFGLSLVGFLGTSVLPMAMDLPNLQYLPDSPLYFIASAAVYLFLLLIPLSVLGAILRYRLWDIDIIINRTLVYLTLTAGIVLLYIVIVGGLGELLQSRNNLLISLVTTGIVAVIFQPFRLLIQHGVNHMMYGEREEPYKVISRLGRQLETTLAPGAVLPAIVKTVAQALKLPFVAIELQKGANLVPVVSFGQAPDTSGIIRLPLVFQNETVGFLQLAPRSPNEPLGRADERLLDDLARQAGIAAYNVVLTENLRQLNVELVQSRTGIVTAREEERRRLRRDLHDGLGSALTGISFKMDAASNLLTTNPARSALLMKELKEQIHLSIADIRRLVYNLRPPALDELGLVEAIRQFTQQYDSQSLVINFQAQLPAQSLPAAVEMAVYRVAVEAVTNVGRHAGGATECCLSLYLERGLLTLEVTDNGLGLPPDFRAGVGVSAMRERAAELGGQLELGPNHSVKGGTRVRLNIPVVLEGDLKGEWSGEYTSIAAPTP